jgi:hypothetical protein
MREMNQTQLCEASGRNHKTVRNRLQDIQPLREEGGQKIYAAPEALEAIFSGEAANTTAEMMREKARLTRIMADNKLLENVRAVNSVIDREEWQKQMTNVVLAFKATIRFMASAIVDDLGTDKEANRKLITDRAYDALETMTRVEISGDVPEEFKDLMPCP